MGEEISSTHFDPSDFEEFAARLESETRLLKTWFAQNKFSRTEGVGGFELEAWLVNPRCQPLGINTSFLQAVDNPLVVPELSTFNVEFNTPPAGLKGSALSDMHTALNAIWSASQHTATDLGASLMMMGILPTIEKEDLCLEHISALNRFYALNEQILNARNDIPIKLDIQGKDHLELEHNDVVLEAAATSFQIHLQVSTDEAVAVYNASIAASAPMVAISANSPFLFGKDLWAETRIPLFEQSIAINQPHYRERVTFGTRYLDASFCEMFEANRDHFATLLPLLTGEPPDTLHHLRLHNGTIWRWNRGLIGFDEAGTPHLRIEHRPVPAGPTVEDCIANAAFYFGLAYGLAAEFPDMDSAIPFSDAKENFYRCARLGLDALVGWHDKKRVPIRDLILETLIPLAQKHLLDKGLSAADVDRFLQVIEARAESGQNGAAWQRACAKNTGGNFEEMTGIYLRNQERGDPVHMWAL